jgi:hypothetical protein
MTERFLPLGNLRENEIAIDGGVIVIQACDSKSANVGIYIRKHRHQMVYYRVAIPSLTREWKPEYPNKALSPAEFDVILQANKTCLLEVVRRLNTVKPPKNSDKAMMVQAAFAI